MNLRLGGALMVAMVAVGLLGVSVAAASPGVRHGAIRATQGSVGVEAPATRAVAAPAPTRAAADTLAAPLALRR